MIRRSKSFTEKTRTFSIKEAEGVLGGTESEEIEISLYHVSIYLYWMDKLSSALKVN